MDPYYIREKIDKMIDKLSYCGAFSSLFRDDLQIVSGPDLDELKNAFFSIKGARTVKLIVKHPKFEIIQEFKEFQKEYGKSFNRQDAWKIKEITNDELINEWIKEHGPHEVSFKISSVSREGKNAFGVWWKMVGFLDRQYFWRYTFIYSTEQKTGKLLSRERMLTQTELFEKEVDGMPIRSMCHLCNRDIDDCECD